MTEKMDRKNIDKNAPSSTISLFGEFMSSIAERGMAFIDTNWYRRETDAVERLVRACELLLSAKGEASGIAIAGEAINIYQALSGSEKEQFLILAADRFGVDAGGVEQAARTYAEAPSDTGMAGLARAVRAPFRNVLERLNQSHAATLALVQMRADLLRIASTSQALQRLDGEFVDLFSSWFNRGFLELRRIDWNTSAALLEKIIRYEAVHKLEGWDDLRRRILPQDRCLYGFFHPRLGNEPLIFVEVALTRGTPHTIGTILTGERVELDAHRVDTAVFYSISNCQDGLRGIPLGSFLIKQVVADLKARYPRINTFVTLSPVPGLAGWLRREIEAGTIALPPAVGSWDELESALPAAGAEDDLSHWMRAVVAHYIVQARDKSGRIIDPVARFHLGNGARLERINVAADLSVSAQKTALGTMVNYLYAIGEIERNHETFVNGGPVATTPAISRLAKTGPLAHNNDIFRPTPENFKNDERRARTS